MSTPALTTAATDPQATLGWFKIGGSAFGVLAAIVLWFAPLPLEPKAQQALAIGVLLIAFWITEILPHAVTGLLGCWLFWALGVVPARVALGGFSSDAPWFLMGALFIGAMATESGLAKRLAYTMLSKVGTSFPRVLLAFIITDFVMTFMVPAGPPRVILLGTIIMGLVATYGLAKDSNISKALLLAITFSATLFDKGVIGSTPSIVARNMIEQYGHVQVYWSQWFIAFAPLDFINVLLGWWILQRMYPPEMKALPGGTAFIQEQKAKLGPWSASEKKAAFWTIVAVCLWATDFLHHINPAIVGLGVGLVATFPKVGVLTKEHLGRLNFMIVIFMGATISMAGVLQETGAVKILSDGLFGYIGPLIDTPFHSTLVLYWGAFVSHLMLASETAMVSISLPVLMEFAHNNGLDPLAIGMLWTFAVGGKLFIYQSLVLIAGYSFGVFNARDVFKVALFFLLAENIALLLLVPLYWPLLGIG
ncbi:MAG TPA: SLC13 family permease [Steroidobacteraceae bacterium]|nr:SLC13 family permease [Steroidobacteraceae bacterium]